MTEIGDRLDLELAESEAGPLRAFLFRSWTNDDGAGAATQVDYASAVAARVIELVSIDVDINLAADPTLHRRLLAHLAPMLIRTEHGIQIQNPVLEGIRTQYPEVHDSVLRAMAVCESEFGIRHINESEAGYLALYLQGALDAQRTLATLRVIAVCSTGRSTAYFLRSRLEQEFPHWEIVDVLGTRELEERMSGEGFTDVDLFVSTVPIPSERVPAAIISPLVTERDLEVIQVAAQQRSGGTK